MAQKEEQSFWDRMKCWGNGPTETIRTLFINSPGDPGRDKHHPHHHYDNNFTTTTKYNLLTFLPKALFEQYRRVANWYFTIVAALSLTAFSPVRPWTTWLPLAIVLGVSLLKEAIEDYKRYKADREVNNREVQVLNADTGAFESKRWRDIRVGEVVQVLKDEYFPADLLFMTAENEEGTCYIETMNLDGETNLKIKKAPDATKGLVKESLHGFQGASVQCELPNARLYQFTGNLMLGPGEGAAKIPISPAAILLRGCSLRNTTRAFGAVIYAGHDTKVFMNATKAPSKRSQVEYIVDKVIFFMFGLLFSFCIIGSVYTDFWLGGSYSNHWYLGVIYTNSQYDPDRAVEGGATNFVTCFILYGYLIPISLYVSMEMVKITQSMVFISRDLHMYHEETDTPAQARTSNLNEDLGMVNTVLSDKTGTLTRNVMEFFKCSIAGVSYGAGVTEIERSNAERRGETLPDTSGDPLQQQYRERFFNFYDKRIMGGQWTGTPDAPIIEMYLRLLAVCHTVIPDGPQTEADIKYEAESPDEAALVVAAKVLGFFFFKRSNTSVTVRELTSKGTANVEYEVLNILEFNSTRKRMSVIVRDTAGKLYLFCKGADTVIYERLDPQNPQNQRLKGPTTAHMEEYGSAGLRTLCLSYAMLDPAFYEGWQAQYTAAKTSLQDRDAKLTEVSELIEKNLVLLGCTAIEDKLQEGVPQCIATLAQAGIRLWVLTGDKMETAINIAFACSLITEEMQQFIVSASFNDVEELEIAGRADEAAKLANERVEQQLKQVQAEIQAVRAGAGGASPSLQYAMVIDGKALSFALSERLAPLFLDVGLQCQAVICCRVSPMQKAQVTALVRSHGDVTLAIGDGANDVGMIQKAHIGVGISGQEGMQAVMAADFAIAQFRFLTPLLLVHGRWSYKRIARMICFFFYKNLLFGITIFTFNAFTNFSGQYMYSDVYMTLFNVIFTALTPIVIGMFDRDVDRQMGLRYPALYKQGQRNTYFNFTAIAGWLVTSAFQAGVICTLILVGCNATTLSRQEGDPFGMYEVGVLMFSCIVLTVHLQISAVEEQWTWLHHLSIWGSQLTWWIFLLIFDALPLSISQDLWRLFLGISAWSPQYWLYCLLVPVACQAPDFLFRALRRQLDPADHQLVLEEQYLQRSVPSSVLPTDASTTAFGNGAALPSTLYARANGVPSKGANGTANGARTIFHIFDQKNTGFVPPYNPKSQFYQLVAQPSGAMQMQPPQSQVGRSPVLQHLDQTLASPLARVENPYRSGKSALSAGPLSPVSPASLIPSPGARLNGGSASGGLSLPSVAGASTNPSMLQKANPNMTAAEADMLAAYAEALEK